MANCGKGSSACIGSRRHVSFEDCDLHKVGILSTRIEDMDVSSLNYWLSKFVMEGAKKIGERYSPKTVYGIVCGIRRHLEAGEEQS